jgi:hypothetical protein
MSQSDMILNHLRSGGTLTVLEALDLFGCYALSQRVTDLKRAGNPIRSERVELPNGKKVSRYSMEVNRV